MNGWALASLAVAGAAVTLAVFGDAKVDGGGGVSGQPSAHKLRLWNKLRSIVELDDDQRGFFMVCAGGETGQKYRPTAHNGSASERLAAARAADNNHKLVARAVACGVPADALRTGSWGVFQRLAPFLSGDAFEIFGDAGCGLADPRTTSLDFQIASALETAGDLQGYGAWKAYPTVGNLRLGWAAPALMGYIAANQDRINRYRRQATETGYPASFVDRPLKPMPRNVADIYRRLVAGGM